jgi:hypothetical protein
VFDEIPRHHAGVIARAAGHDLHRLDTLEDRRSGRSKCGFQQSAIGHALLQRIGHGARLLVNLLEHEVLVLALLSRVG